MNLSEAALHNPNINIFRTIVILYLAYAGLFIWRSSFVVDGTRHFTLFDDAMISMRYAENLARPLPGNESELAFNPGGERVEGFTNPLWVLYMSLIHLLPVSKPLISLFVQISGALLLLANLFFVRRLAVSAAGREDASSHAAVIFTAFYLPLNYWGLMGTETGLLALITTAAALMAVVALREKRFRFRIFILLGIGTFVRLDYAVIYLAFMTFLIAASPGNRVKYLLSAGFILLLFIASQTAFRAVYYGEYLPNTYYLKMTGFPILLRLSRGLYVMCDLAWRMSFMVFLLPLAVLLFRRDKSVLLLISVSAAQALYSVYAGGDAWEWWGGSNRFLSVVVPLVFVLAALSVREAAHGMDTFMKKGQVLLLLFASLFLSNEFFGPVGINEQDPLKRYINIYSAGELVKTTAVALIFSGSAIIAFHGRLRERFYPAIYLLFLVSAILKAEAIFPFLALFPIVIMLDGERRIRHIICASVSIAALAFAQYAFRVWTTMDFRHTFFAMSLEYPYKSELDNGLYVAMDMLWRLRWPVVFFAAMFAYVWKNKSELVISALFVCASMFLAEFFTHAYAGFGFSEAWGDAGGYIAIFLPICLSCILIIAAAALRHYAGKRDRGDASAARPAAALMIFAVLIGVNALHGPQALGEWLLLKKTLHVEDHERNLKAALHVKETTKPDARIATALAGIIPYFSGRETIDLLGKNDKRIAREEAKMPSGIPPLIAFYPGHMKYDYNYSIRELKPDIVFVHMRTTLDEMLLLKNRYSEADEGGETLFFKNY